jgi:hypothetical protein
VNEYAKEFEYVSAFDAVAVREVLEAGAIINTTGFVALGASMVFELLMRPGPTNMLRPRVEYGASAS